MPSGIAFRIDPAAKSCDLVSRISAERKRKIKQDYCVIDNVSHNLFRYI